MSAAPYKGEVGRNASFDKHKMNTQNHRLPTAEPPEDFQAEPMAFDIKSSQNDSVIKSTHQKYQPFSCFRFRRPAMGSTTFWDPSLKFIQVAAREIGVVLILLEALILLGGYLMILAVHYSIRVFIRKLKKKRDVEDDNVQYMHIRNHEVRPVVPRRLPRGRMAGG
ncbi:unnamed protein product [Orchesella dallaii]|uniref:Uncharacterized protein n=1 Tax=Orchesella dallaii TaxID=48710 RepID=A0ABP1QFF9_9HEXA